MRVTPSSDGRATLLAVKLVPGASRTRVAGIHGDSLRVSVTSAPEKGRANAALCELMASLLGVPARDVSVVRGTTSPSKTVRIDGLAPAEVLRRLAS